MVAFNKVNTFVLEIGQESHQFATDTLKVALSNTAPTASSTVWNTTAFPAPAAAAGYTAGGNSLTGVTWTQTSGTAKLVASDTTFTASGGSIGPFQYAILYNNNATGQMVIGYYNYGSAVTLADTETFTVDFDPTNGVLQIV